MARNPWLDALEQRYALGDDTDLQADTPAEVLAAGAIAYELRAIRDLLAATLDPPNDRGWHDPLD